MNDQQLDEYAVLAITADHNGDKIDPAIVTALVDEVRKLNHQRNWLLKQSAKKDARTGEGDGVLREFLAADVPAASEEQR